MILRKCAALGKLFPARNGKIVRLVTDAGIAEKNLTRPVEKALQKSRIRYIIYDKTKPNPTADTEEDTPILY